MRFENGMSAGLLESAVWHKSSASNPTGNCVEVAGLPGGSVAVRNSRYPAGPALVYTGAEIAAFVAGAKNGEFDDLCRDAIAHGDKLGGLIPGTPGNPVCVLVRECPRDILVRVMR